MALKATETLGVFRLKVLRNLIASHPQFDFFPLPTLTIPNFEILDFSFQPPWVFLVSLGEAGLVLVLCLSLLDARLKWSLGAH